MTNFLISGATAELGHGIVKQLLRRVPASDIAVLTRNPSAAVGLVNCGGKIRQGDYQDKASLESVLRVRTMMFLSKTPFSDDVNQHLNVVHASQKTGIRHIHYTGMHRPKSSIFVLSQVTEWHKLAEEALASTGIEVTHYATQGRFTTS